MIVHRIWLLIVCICLFEAHNSLAEDAQWPEFRGPGQQGIATAKNVPLRWSETENIAWKTPLSGQGWSSPVLVAGQVLLTAAVPRADAPNDFDLCLQSYATTDGKLQWQTNIFAEAESTAPKIHSKNSHASPTPIVSNGRVYVHFGHMGTACVDLQGKILWQTNEVKYAPVHGNGGSPALVGDKLIFSCDGASEPRVVALDAETGKQLWSTPRPNDPPKKFAFCTPLAIEVAGKTQVILPAAGSVCSYDPASGEELWRVNYDGYSVIPRPLFANGLVYVSSSFDSPRVLAIKPDGRGDVTDTHVVWTAKKGAPHSSSMIVGGENLFMVSDGGVATCLDAKTGEQIWQERLGGGFSASLVLAEDRLYCQDENGTCHVLAAGREFKKLSENKLPERTLASYAVVDGTILLRGDKHLYRIGIR